MNSTVGPHFLPGQSPIHPAGMSGGGVGPLMSAGGTGTSETVNIDDVVSPIRQDAEGAAAPVEKTPKEQYRLLKRRFKLLVYENECYQDELRNLQRKLLKLSRDKNFLLDRLIQYEQVSGSSDDSDNGGTNKADEKKPNKKKCSSQSSRGKKTALVDNSNQSAAAPPQPPSIPASQQFQPPPPLASVSDSLPASLLAD